jgi:protein NrfC
MDENEKLKTGGVSRREFVVGLGGAGVAAVLAGTAANWMLLPEKVVAIPASKGYLLVDTKKCASCESCMLTCSLVHTGENNLSYSRIQVVGDPFAAFPNGAAQKQCRQCPYPACVEACPTGANHVDTAHGNVRTIDPAKCIGCERCIAACPFEPVRVQWNDEERHSQKCDLCTNTPFWDEAGGIGGKQACVEVCPMHAITFTADIPSQVGDTGYQVNLRQDSPNWTTWGLPTADNGEYVTQPGASGVVGG